MIISAPESTEKANSNVNLPVYSNMQYLKNMFNKTVELMASRYGVFVFQQDIMCQKIGC